MRNTRRLTYKPKSSLNALISIAIVIFVFLGSQSILSSYPSQIIISNDTIFPPASISANQITFTSHQIQSIETGSVMPIQNGYVRFSANQIQNSDVRDALKYTSYQLNHVLLLERQLQNWDIFTSQQTLSTDDPSQKIILQFSQSDNTLLITTPLSRYSTKFQSDSFVLVSSDDSSLLYKLSRDENIAKITIIGFYPSSTVIYQS